MNLENIEERIFYTRMRIDNLSKVGEIVATTLTSREKETETKRTVIFETWMRIEKQSKLSEKVAPTLIQAKKSKSKTKKKTKNGLIQLE